MLRQASSRNQRNKGFRMKHFLQICLLVAISVWLLYQLKHSYDKKRALEVRNSKIFDKVAESHSDFFKLGRKDLLPRSEETGSVNETHNKEDENEEVEEEEEHETKPEIENEEGRGGAGDDEIDEIDEQDQERGDEESERGEEFTEEEDKLVQAEGAELLDDREHEEHEGDSQGAREENYKRDDASSAVRHDTRTAESEFGNGDSRSLDEERMEGKDVERENMANEAVDGSKETSEVNVGTLDGSNGNVSDVVLGESETTPNDSLSMNGTSVEERVPEVGVSNSEVITSMSNSTVPEHDSQTKSQTNSTESTESDTQIELQANSTTNISDNKMETQNNSTEVVGVTDGVPLQNGTVGLDSVQDRNATTVDLGVPGDDRPRLADGVIEQTTDKSNTRENGDAARGGSDDSSHNTVKVEDGDTSTDLSTSSSTQNEARNNEAVAEE